MINNGDNDMDNSVDKPVSMREKRLLELQAQLPPKLTREESDNLARKTARKTKKQFKERRDAIGLTRDHARDSRTEYELTILAENEGVATNALLTEFQDEYCYHRALGYNRREAARKAGSMAKTEEALYNVGEKLENHPRLKNKIRERIGFYEDQFSKTANIKVEEMVGNLKDLYYRALESGNVKVAMEVLREIATIGGIVTTATFGKGTTVPGSQGGGQKNTSSMGGNGGKLNVPNAGLASHPNRNPEAASHSNRDDYEGLAEGKEDLLLSQDTSSEIHRLLKIVSIDKK